MNHNQQSSNSYQLPDHVAPKDTNDPYSSQDFNEMDEVEVQNSQNGKAKKRGRKPSKVDMKGRLEKSRQSARECRARKKLRYQYCEELVADRERAIFSLREELELYRKFCHKIDQGVVPNEVKKLVDDEMKRANQGKSTN